MFLGLDIGTTSVCAVVLNGQGEVLFTATESNSFQSAGKNGERIQDVEKIYALCEKLYQQARQNFSLAAIGVSGQMHGIVYVDCDGNAVSPLYSWQDGRGDLPFGSSTYAKTLSALSGHKIATGYGCCSLFYDTVNGKIPEKASCFCTVGDYVAMRLARQNKPLLNATNAASIGLYSLQRRGWDFSAIEQAGLDKKLFPATTQTAEALGKTADGVTVYAAIGDNQASVYGSTKTDDFLLVNVGTGSQISLLTDRIYAVDGLETRPYFDEKYLLIGSALCGGYSYKLLKDFFSSVAGKEIPYSQMNEWAKQALNADLPLTSPLFRGTRENPSLRASVTGITDSNFNAPALAASVLKGISGELAAFYKKAEKVVGKRTTLVASGNAVRMNPVLQTILTEEYALPLSIPAHKEEAAFGAALLCAEAFEQRSLKQFIRYE